MRDHFNERPGSPASRPIAQNVLPDPVTITGGLDLSPNTSGTDVEIQGNTMNVANEMYHLGNVSRVSTYTNLVGFHGTPLRAVWLKKWWIVFALILFISGASSGSAALLILALVVAFVTAARIMQMLQKKRTEYVLRLESAGVVRGVLASEDPNAIEQLVEKITEAIRKPPITSQHMHLPNVRVIENAEFNQYGDRSIGIQQST
jgi:hypothetical protein